MLSLPISRAQTTGEAPMSVSVAIWTCNQEQFIGEAIESALAQDYPEI